VRLGARNEGFSPSPPRDGRVLSFIDYSVRDMSRRVTRFYSGHQSLWAEVFLLRSMREIAFFP